MGKYYTADELAKAWRVKTRTIWRWIREGRLEAMAVGRSYRIHEDTVKQGVPPRKSGSLESTQGN